MFSYLLSAFNYFFSKHSEIDSDDDKEDFLAEQLVELEAVQLQEDYNVDLPATPKVIPRNTQCFQRTGKQYV